MIKKTIITSSIIALALAFSLSACGDKTASSAASSASEEVSSVEEVTVEPTQGEGEGNKYTNAYFGLNLEFPEDWTLVTEGAWSGPYEFPYFQSANDGRSFAFFQFSDADGLTNYKIIETSEITVNGATCEGNLILAQNDVDKGIAFLMEKEDSTLLCIIWNVDCSTISDYQAFIDSISK